MGTNSKQNIHIWINSYDLIRKKLTFLFLFSLQAINAKLEKNLMCRRGCAILLNMGSFSELMPVSLN